jgi:NADP-dependent 3-hydroxy acid dehydrogenase YdfG
MTTSGSGATLSSRKGLVIGANGGIGSAVALALSQHGVELALVGRNQAAIEKIADTCKDTDTRSLPLVCDITEPDNIETTVNTAIEQLGGLNYLINCAGISAEAKLHETDFASSLAILDTNLRAHLYFARHALPEINRHTGGAVVKIGAVDHPYSGANTYLAASRGAEGLAAAMFEDVREFGTKICTIRPGWVNTALVQADGLDPALMIQPNDIAQTVLFVLSLPDTACPTEITLLPQRSPYC